VGGEVIAEYQVIMIQPVPLGLVLPEVMVLGHLLELQVEMEQPAQQAVTELHHL
jgi:hypothetical protein